ncbi:hypothetical protein MSP7336_02809 [Mycobacterium shimoidei]|uniref:Uncharacterized protein n=1 Tax=Mycobacterium shimoidei TaxID=29313 RepID=A0A375Z0F0_MYCSH|nr:EspA/EspE family type VII secretion system effector [Mycobacterium shimoidei]SRX94552.1 hypothetical protein MSP7336_02809 [Mycobacterium shimoidei]
MGALDAFLSTWSNARSTLGEGTPQQGAQFDRSSELRQAQSGVESAAPGSRWTGAAADSYADANSKQGRVLGQMAGLDQRLGVEVDRSAAVVAAGRQNLDQVKQWVMDAASTVPQGVDREQALMPIARKGIGDVAEVVRQTNNDLNAIGARIQTIGNEYQALGDDKDGKKDPSNPTDPKDPRDINKFGPEEKYPPEFRQANFDVSQVLAGTATPEQLARVRSGLALSPQQQADYEAGRHVDLTDHQKLILGQMQSQMNGMSVSDIRAAEQRLGEDKHLIGDALQMMSSDKFDYTKVTWSVFGPPTETVQGGADQLPTSVRDVLTRPAAETHSLPVPGGPSASVTGYPTINELRDLAGIVQDGNPALQQGTYLDHALLDKGAEMLAAEQIDNKNPANVEPNQQQVDPTVQDIFRAAGRDTIVDHDVLTGPNGQTLLQNMSTHDWADNGAAASTLTNWIHDAAGSSNDAVATRAGETAHALASYLGSDAGKGLLNIETNPFTHTHTTVGQLNPDLLRGYSNALIPYQDAMVGDYHGTKGFTALDGFEHGELPKTRQLFAIMDSDWDPKNPNTAANAFNQAAYEHALRYEHEFGVAASEGDVNDPSSPHRLDMARAGALAGLVEAGAKDATGYSNEQSLANAKAAYDIKKTALDFMFGQATSHIPGVGGIINELGKSTINDAFLGKEPTLENGHVVEHRSIQDEQNLAYYTIASPLIANDPNSHIPAQYFAPDGHLLSPTEIQNSENLGSGELASYYASLNEYLEQHGLGSDVDVKFRDSYENVTR